jgi:hypothetical protein
VATTTFLQELQQLDPKQTVPWEIIMERTIEKTGFHRELKTTVRLPETHTQKGTS